MSNNEIEIYKSPEIEAEIQAQVDKIRSAVEAGRIVSCNYDNGCATFIIYAPNEHGEWQYENQREICGNDLVYALAYALGVEDVFSA